MHKKESFISLILELDVNGSEGHGPKQDKYGITTPD